MTRPAVPCTEPAMWSRTPSPQGKLLDYNSLNIQSTGTTSRHQIKRLEKIELKFIDVDTGNRQ